MHHPNQGFLRKFLGTDKEYQAQQKVIQRKREVAEFFERKNNKTYVLDEEHKKSIGKTIDKVYKSRTNLILTEQKVSNKNWRPINTAYGIYYYNEEENLWMNNFGVIKKSLAEFIQTIDYGNLDSSSQNSSVTIEAPTNLQVNVVNNGVGSFDIQFTDNSTNEDGFAIYLVQL